MELLILVAFVLLAGFFFVVLSRLQRGGDKHEHDAHCGHDHGCCHHDHDHDHAHHHHDHDHDGKCCGGKH